MAEGRRDHPGGIFGLRDLLDEHAEAIEADLLDRGWRLAEVGHTFSWRDLLIMVRRFQSIPTTATSRAIHGEYWSTTDQLLASVVDLLQVGNWQRAGKKNSPKPKRLKRPWERSAGHHLGAEPIPLNEFSDWWEQASNGGER